MPEPDASPRMTHKEWLAEGERRFGSDMMKWRFVCPVCQHVQSTQDYKDAGAPQESVGFACVGRWIEGTREAFATDGKKQKKDGPCNYTGGGLFRLNPVIVVFEDGKEVGAFAFADPEESWI